MSNINTQIYFGVCKNTSDPLMLGRIRVEPIGVNITSRDKSSPGFDEKSKTPDKNGPWSDKDPYIFLPLLPYFINQVPQPGESVMLMYASTLSDTSKNKFYIFGGFSSATNIKYENYSSSQVHLDSGAVNSTKKIPPIKNSNDTYVNDNYSGVFAEPIDISFNGRDSADIIIKENELILRAGKHKPFSSGQIPVADDGRAYVQLSKYFSKTSYGEPESETRLVKNDVPIKYLIEYDVQNPENPYSAFTANIYVYSLKTEDNAYATLAGNFDINTDINLTGSTNGVTLIRMINLPIGLNFDSLSLEINQRLKSMITNPSAMLLSSTIKIDEQYPFYFRPSKRILDITTKVSEVGDLISSYNMSRLMSLIKISNADITPGYGLVMDRKLSPYLPYKPRKEVFVPSSSELIENSAALMGANQIYLLSHDSTIPGKDKIDMSKTVYGIGQNLILDNIEPNTSSMVRGEELLELLQLIVRFCITHVHPYPLMPPSSVTLDGLSTDDLLGKMQSAYQNILNSNIRIN